MARFKHAIFIYNANAGQKDISRTLRICVPILSSAIDELLLLKTDRPGHAQLLCSEYGEHTDLVVILGGDGTVHECVNGLASLAKRPAIAILPGGTCNDISRTLNMPQDIRQAAETVVSGKLVPLDAMDINGHCALNFWGVGLVTEVSNNIKDSEKALLGKVSYYLSAIRTMREMEPFSYTVQCDGKLYEGEAVMVLAANGRYIGTNELPFRNIHADDGKANVFIIKNTNLALMKEVFTLDITLEEDSASEVLHCSGSEIVIQTESKMEADMDGEVYLETPAHIRVLKHHFFAIVPSSGSLG
ncbi:diacylglycerol/lipid kinase family protein [Neobacillus notoginsengisoli]|uniref:diacylglycerol/lipid kinase family protein n=1 Tax=Neobacillus notoginsengisoli TaxID=1578198 RepID=UPI00186509FD|nr:YegS/Rv2252/BmrU family lipid kinase [Neobacillus notoginsengisoli]